MKTIGFLLARVAIVAVFLSATPAYATPILVTVDTSALSGIVADLAFDLIDGGPPGNTVTISGFTTNGTLGASSSTGVVTGTFPGAVTLADTSFFSEYLQQVTLGNSFSFVFDTTGNAPGPTSFPDGFSFFILDHTTGLSLVTTSDPTGANALFLFNIGISALPEIYSSDSVRVTAQAVTNGVPEPGSLALLATALVALSARRRFMP
jgi:hypothetical protein